MTVSIVVAASIIVERSGPFIGAMIASLPTAGGAAMIILAMEHTPDFIAQSAIGNLIANAACAVFALTYASPVQWSAFSATLLNVLVYPLTIYLGRKYRSAGAVRRVELSANDLAWRAGV